jgi:hypothetical protein
MLARHSLIASAPSAVIRRRAILVLAVPLAFRSAHDAPKLRKMLSSQIIRYVALAGQLALAVGAAAVITMLLRYVISGL